MQALRFNTSIILLFLTLSLYLLALNPYLLPGIYDDIVYMAGAQSLALQGTYTYDGVQIADWPPLTSLLIATAYLFGCKELITLKSLMILFVVAGAFALYRLLTELNRPFAKWTLFLFLLTPSSLIWGTQVMSDWPYTAFSFVFLFFLHKLSISRRLSDALLACLFFSLCLFTRYFAIGLTIALALQIYIIAKQRNKESLFKECALELFVLGIGYALFLVGWVYPIVLAAQKNPYIVKYYHSLDFLSRFYPLDFFRTLAEIFLFPKSLQLYLGGSLSLIAGIAIFCTILYGFFCLYKEEKSSPLDYYVLAGLCVIACHEAKQSRFFLPIIPFLYSYFLTGVKSLYQVMLEKKLISGNPYTSLLLPIWSIVLISMDTFLLIKGNSRTFQGLNPIISPTPKDFYLGYWKELYEMIENLKALPIVDPIGIFHIGDIKYIRYFSGRQTKNISESQQVKWILAPNDKRFKEALKKNWELKVVNKTTYFVLYERL